MPIPLKLYRCLGHGLKMCIWFQYNNPQIIFCNFFHKLKIVIFEGKLNIKGILCWQLLQQFHADSFETLQVFRSWSEDVHLVQYNNPQITFCNFFHKLKIVIFEGKLNIKGILCWQLLLQFYADSFETLQVFRSWSEDVHLVSI